MKTNLKNKIIKMIIFFLISFIALYIVLKDFNFKDIMQNLKTINLTYILLGIAAMVIFILCEALNIHRILNKLHSPVTLLKSIKYALIGFFFSSITPSASGGEPAQIYFMSKDNIQISHSAITLLTELFVYQLVSCLLAVTGFIFNNKIIINNLGNIKLLLIIGLALNILIMSILLIFLFSKKMAIKLVDITCYILTKLHKPTNVIRNKLLNQIEEYHQCSNYLKTNRLELLKIFLTTLIRMLVYFSIPYLVYLSFGYHEISIMTFISLESVLYITVSSLPLPGAMGVSEGGFMIIFKTCFNLELLSSAMIIARTISFYLPVIISGVLILIVAIYEKSKKFLEENKFNI